MRPEPERGKVSQASQPVAQQSETHDSTASPSPVASLHGTIGNQAIQRQVKAGTGSNPSIRESDSRSGREAERAADQVNPLTGSTPAAGPPEVHRRDTRPRVQRMCTRCRERLRQGRSLDCADCESHILRKAQTGMDHLEPQPVHRTERRGERAADGDRDHGQEVRRDRSGGEPTSETAPPIVSDVLRSAGQPIDPSTRHFMESQFARDFGHVRLHTSAKAARSARAIGARAYTVGPDIVFGRGEHDPATVGGQRLLAHELAHVIQQSTATMSDANLSVQPSDDAFEREADAAAASIAEGRQTQVQRRTDHPRIAREQTRTRETTVTDREDRQVRVTQIVTAGECNSVPVSPGGVTGGVRGQEAFFEATFCRGRTAGEASGSADFSDVLTSVADSINELSRGRPGRARDELRQATLRGEVDLALQFDSLRVEVSGSGGASVAEQELDVQGVLRYSNGQFRLDIRGSHEMLQSALAEQSVSGLQLNTDIGPVEIRLGASRSATSERSGPGATPAQREQFTVEGTVRYRTESGVGIGVFSEFQHEELPGGGERNQIVGGLEVRPGGSLPEVQPPDCTRCKCQKPEIRYVCRELPEPTPDEPGGERITRTQPVIVPLFFEHAETNPRPDWADEYPRMIDRAVELIQEGYTIARIEGRTSPEGPLEQVQEGGFGGNIQLARDRAVEAHRGLQEAIRSRLTEFGEDSDLRRRLEAALRGNYQIQGTAPEGGPASSELFGSTEQGPVPNEQLYEHLVRTLRDESDPLAQEHVLGEELPSNIQAEVQDAVEAFFERRETAPTGSRRLSRSEASERLFRVLRRAIIVLEPPQQQQPRIDLTISPESYEAIFGEEIPCTRRHRDAFADQPIPTDWLFEDRCSSDGS